MLKINKIKDKSRMVVEGFAESIMELDIDLIKDTQQLNGVVTGEAAILKNRCLVDSDKAKVELERAQDEWDSVCYSVPDETVKCLVKSSLIGVEEVIEHFRSSDMSPYMTNIVPVINRSKVSSLFRFIWGPPKLDCTLEDERKLVFAIACCPFKNDDGIHLQVLETIYKQLTNSQCDCPRYGAHWEEIGFQGNDPATDLRGVGFLGLVHLLHFVMDPDTLSLARTILKLSHHETQNFPFAVMGINLTRIVLQTLREEKLNRDCNQQQNIVRVTNDFYVGIFLHLYTIWYKNNVTIERSGWVLKDVELFAKKKPKLVFKELQEYIKEQKRKKELPTQMLTDTALEEKIEGTTMPSIFSDIESEIRYVDEEQFI